MKEYSRRDLWKREQRCCFACLKPVGDGYGFETHELIGGQADRHKTVNLPAFWIFLCCDCHSLLGSRPSQESLIRQLCWKKLRDRPNYHPDDVIRMWRPKCTDGLVKEIIDAVNELAKGNYHAIR